MVAKRISVWKHPDTGAANYLKLSVPGAQSGKNPALYI
jgi:hypothetical protein